MGLQIGRRLLIATPPGPTILIGESERKKGGPVVRSDLLQSFLGSVGLCCAFNQPQ
jgi:hypothetical protein